MNSCLAIVWTDGCCFSSALLAQETLRTAKLHRNRPKIRVCMCLCVCVPSIQNSLNQKPQNPTKTPQASNQNPSSKPPQKPKPCAQDKAARLRLLQPIITTLSLTAIPENEKPIAGELLGKPGMCCLGGGQHSPHRQQPWPHPENLL